MSEKQFSNTLPKDAQPYAIRMEQGETGYAFFQLRVPVSRESLDRAFREFSISTHPDRHVGVLDYVSENLSSLFSYGQRLYLSLRENLDIDIRSPKSTSNAGDPPAEKIVVADTRAESTKPTTTVGQIKRGAGRRLMRHLIKQKLGSSAEHRDPQGAADLGSKNNE